MTPYAPQHAYQPQQHRDMVPHLAAWPPLGLALIGVVTTLTARMFHYPAVIALGMATVMAAVAGLVVCIQRRSTLVWAPAVAGVVGLFVLVFGFLAMSEFADAWQQLQTALADLANLFGGVPA